MQDGVYAETLVKRKMQAWAGLVMVFMILGILFAVTLIIIGQGLIGGIAAVVVGISIFLFYRFLKVEYEFIFVTDELQVDRIYNQSLRKAGPRITIGDIESVEPMREGFVEEQRKNPNVVIQDFLSHLDAGTPYVVRYSKNGKMYCLLFEPSAELLAVMKRMGPRKVQIIQ